MGSPTVDPDVLAPSAAFLRRSRRRLRTAGRPGRWAQRRQALRGTGGLRILGAAAGGFLLNLAFAPSTWWWAAMVGMALFGLAAHGRRLSPALGLGLVFGLAFYVPLLHWTTVYVGGVALALAIAEAILTAPVAAMIASASRRLPLWPLWAAAAWVAGEALRARFPFGGFPWGGIAYSQPDGPLLPIAALLGAGGLAFATALAGFGLADGARTVWLHRRAFRPARLVVPVIMILVPVGLGVAALAVVQRGTGAPTTTIAVVQGNVPEPGLEFNQRRRAVLDMHAQETHLLAAAIRAGRQPKPALVIWPENSSDIDPYTNPDAAAVITAAVRDVGVPVLVGAVVGNGRAGSGAAGDYNMGIVWDPVTGPGQTYTKRHPVPFAEYMPYRSFFRIFSSWVDQAGYFIPGHDPGNLKIAGVDVGDVICFEVVYDDLVRDVVNGGATVLVVQTNNATFGYTDETYQQQAMSRVRAVEHGREVLISATSGVSAVIRPDGRVESSVGLFAPGSLVSTVPLISATTPGTVLGAPVEWTLTVAVVLGLTGVTALGWRRRHTTAGVIEFRRGANGIDEPDTDPPAPQEDTRT